MNHSVGLILICGALAVGCNEQSNLAAQPYARATAAVTTHTPTGPFPRGLVTRTTLDPATTGPELTVVSPDRGAIVSTSQVRVRVSAEDPNGVYSVVIGNRTGSSVGGDLFEAYVDLEPGLNYVTVEAFDRLGNASRSTFSIGRGQLHSQDELLESCVSVSLGNSGLAKVVPVIDNLAAKLDIPTLVLSKNPLYEGSVTKVWATALTHHAPSISISGVSGGVLGKVVMGNLDVQAKVKVLGITTSVHLRADRLNVLANVAATDDPKNSFGLAIRRVDVSFDNFDVDSSGFLTDAVLGLLKGTVREKLQDMLADMISSEVLTLMSSGLIGIDKPVAIGKPGSAQVDAQFRLAAADGDRSTGVGLALSVMSKPTHPKVGTANQFLVQGTRALPTVTGNDDIAVFFTADAINGFLHAFWAEGGLELTVDGAQPRLGGEFITVRMLYPFFPQVRQLAPNGDTPLRIDVSAATAPVVSLGKDGRLVHFGMGETEVKVSIDYMDGQAPLEFVTFRVPVEVAADVAIQGRNLSVTGLEIPVMRFDVVRDPAIDLNDEQIERFGDSLMPLLLPEITKLLPTMPIPAIPFGIDFDTAWLEASHDVLAVRATLK